MSATDYERLATHTRTQCMSLAVTRYSLPEPRTPPHSGPRPSIISIRLTVSNDSLGYQDREIMIVKG